jgi:2-oxoglutarate ferredoxin oxidoreductase subunit delta
MARGKPEIDREKCTGCNLCAQVCPQNILEMSERVQSRGKSLARCIDEDRCIACWECARACPVHAIRIWCFSITAGG